MVESNKLKKSKMVLNYLIPCPLCTSFSFIKHKFSLLFSFIFCVFPFFSYIIKCKYKISTNINLKIKKKKKKEEEEEEEEEKLCICCVFLWA